jgi:hypothetical protein
MVYKLAGNCPQIGDFDFDSQRINSSMRKFVNNRTIIRNMNFQDRKITFLFPTKKQSVAGRDWLKLSEFLPFVVIYNILGHGDTRDNLIVI